MSSSVVYQGEKYYTDKENVKEMLDRYGVAIVPNVLGADLCDDYYGEMWSSLEHMTSGWSVPIDRNDEGTYREYYKLFPKHGMLIQNFKVGHAQYVWDIRQNTEIVDVFSKGIWGCNNEDLLVSFDGVSFGLPPEITNRGWERGNDWLHTDQSYTRNEFECIQSFVTLRDVEEGDGTFRFMEGSHLFHKEFADEFDMKDKSDWYKINMEEHYNFYKERGCEEYRIKCPKGSLVLWDSRVIHSGALPLKSRKNKNIRSIVYVCYMPRFLIDGKAMKRTLSKRIKAFEEMRLTSHWPTKCKLFPVYPRTYGQKIEEIQDIESPVLNDLGYKLVGY